MSEISSRERLTATLEHRPSDHPPADIWTTPEIMNALKGHFGTRNEDDVYDHLGVDKITWVRAEPPSEETIVHPAEQDAGPEAPALSEHAGTDEWGVTYRWAQFDAGYYAEVAENPLAGVEDPAALADYPWPDPATYDYAALRRDAAAGGRWVRMLSFISIFEVYCGLKPMDEALMDLYINPEFAHEIVGHIFTVQRDYLRRSLDAAGDEIELVYLSDDMGMQDRPLMSHETWRSFFRDVYAELIAEIHRHGKRAFYHTDGSAFDIVSDLVDLGIDVLNPIQHRCPGMERERLVEAFGDRVVFHGAVENQDVLPFGSPEDVRAEVRKNIEVLGARNGYIVGPCHMIQPGTPLENVLAMYEEARRAG
jgi:uroporphyrinogen decarboxylase